MIYKPPQQKLLRWIALFLIGTFLQLLFYIPTPVLSQSNSCSNITAPLTPEEQIYARAAWQYFVKNYQPATGFTNSTGGYPSGTLWDMGNYLIGILSSATVIKDQDGRLLTRVNPETRLGYEEYAARGFQLWGFNVEHSAVGGEYQTASVEGVKVPTQRHRTDTNSKVNQYTVSNPFLLYALEFGLDPQMRSLFEPIFQAQAERYRRTGIFTASATTLIDRKPYTQAAEQWLQTSSSEPVTEFVQSLRSLILWLSPADQSISDRLITERKALEEAISKKELELVELARFRYIARPKLAGVPHHSEHLDF
ncbi:DUF3131 domain-containing protein [Nostoc sp.]